MRTAPARRGAIPFAAGLVAAVALIIPCRAVPPTAAAGGCTSSDASTLDTEEQAMMPLINAYRASSGLAPLVILPSLESSARWKSADMAANHYLAHDDRARGWSQRFTDCGYGPAYEGENIAEGYGGAEQTFEQWRASAPHNENMLDPNYKSIGIARAESAGGTWYWTTDFGSTMNSTATAASTPAAPNVASTGLGSSLTVGSKAVTSTPGDCLNVRSAPTMTSTVSDCLADGTPVTVVGGPVMADGHTWWQTAAGWVAGDLLRSSS